MSLLIQVWTENRPYRYKKVFASALDRYSHRTADILLLLHRIRLRRFPFTPYLDFSPRFQKMAPKSPVVSLDIIYFHRNIVSTDSNQGLTFIAAVQSENTSYVFYSEPNSGFLCYLKSQIEEKTSPTEPPPYEKVNILVNEQLVVANTTSPQIAAVSYTLSGHDEVFAHSSRR